MPITAEADDSNSAIAQLLKAYGLMKISRNFDRRCNQMLELGLPVPHFHSGIGQEGLMVGAVLPLRRTDQMIYTHRGYGHLLAKGVSVREIALDTFMKHGGTNHGLGGNMHVARPDLGIPGREGVFGTRFGIAAGLALSAKLRSSDDIAVCFYGEAAGARGALYESLNMAVLWNLPVVFVAENNGWSFSSRTEWLFPKGRMSRVWRGFDIPVDEVDGNDVELVASTVDRAATRARQGKGPSVVEALTYRIDPHIWYDPATYQSQAEIEEWRARDPISLLHAKLLERGLSNDELLKIDDSAQQEVVAAFNAVDEAKDGDWTDSLELLVR
jgi:TPP-dependent pyruvate/acetoin dehydrogenase alpha subunit